VDNDYVSHNSLKDTKVPEQQQLEDAMSLEILDPTHETDIRNFTLARRLERLHGVTIGIVSNGKIGTEPFFDALEANFVKEFDVAKVVRRSKSNYSAPADTYLMEEAKHWDAFIAGIGD